MNMLRLLLGHTGTIIIALITLRWMDLDLNRGLPSLFAVVLGAMAWTLIGITAFIAFGR